MDGNREGSKNQGWGFVIHGVQMGQKGKGKVQKMNEVGGESKMPAKRKTGGKGCNREGESEGARE